MTIIMELNTTYNYYLSNFSLSLKITKLSLSVKTFKVDDVRLSDACLSRAFDPPVKLKYLENR